MSQLARGECLGDDTDHLAAAAQHRVGEDAHHPDRAPAIDQSEAPRNQLGPELARRFRVGRARALRGTAEDADSLHSEPANSAVSVPE